MPQEYDPSKRETGNMQRVKCNHPFFNAWPPYGFARPRRFIVPMGATNATKLVSIVRERKPETTEWHSAAGMATG
jgi:hypothetical protein